MFVFFLIIHLILAAIFFLFKDISGRYYESIFFLVSGFLFFFYFSPLYIIGSSEKPEKKAKFPSIISAEKLKNIIPNSRKLLYSGAVTLFYLAVFGIFYSYDIGFDIFIVGISLLLLGLFLVSRQYFPKETITLAFRTNTLFFSALTLIRLMVLLIQPGEITGLFTIETILFLVSWAIVLLMDMTVSQKFKQAVYAFFLGYGFLTLLFYINNFLIADINVVVVLLGTILSVVYFEYITKIPGLKSFDRISKYFWLFLNYLTILYLAVLLLFFRPYFAPEIVGLLFLCAFFQYYVHTKFENYISYLFMIASVILLYSKLLFLYESESFFFYFLFTSLLPGIFVAYTSFVKNIHPYDYYLLYISMILFSIGGIATYFFHFPFSVDSILPASVFLLLESALFFVSFVRLKK